jgi:hypothetical protein
MDKLQFKSKSQIIMVIMLIQEWSKQIYGAVYCRQILNFAFHLKIIMDFL